jgi:hypothetical protein
MSCARPGRPYRISKRSSAMPVCRPAGDANRAPSNERELTR